MSARRSVRIDLAALANGFKRINEDKPVYYSLKHNAILSTNGYTAEIISPQPYDSVVIGLPYIMRDGVCKKVTYRKSSENLKNDIRIMLENLEKFSSNGFHQMMVTECFDTGLIKLSSSYCPEAYADISKFNGRYVENGEQLWCKLETNKNRAPIVTAIENSKPSEYLDLI
ncbi:hypothetical protein [Bacillus sp. 159]|uniref:hypothetical protein n=2 Tax=unclassified Bacillus (in: firmicutes) TaxID=185979 RepID=UPI002406D077|nr:hypothetical protein [Bacillus sp. 159]